MCKEKKLTVDVATLLALKCNMFSTSETCQASMDAALASVPKEFHGAMTTAIMNYRNTLLTTLAKDAFEKEGYMQVKEAVTL